MSRARRGALAGAVTASVAALVAGVGVAANASAAAAHHAPSITAHPSDDTPQVGEQFVVRGVYDGPGRRAHDVKIQTFRDDHWLNLDGARVTTRTDGSYRVRVVLNVRGVRDLRAVGIAGDAHRNSYARFVVEVFR
jgi:hypothetical protein